VVHIIEINNKILNLFFQKYIINQLFLKNLKYSKRKIKYIVNNNIKIDMLL